MKKIAEFSNLIDLVKRFPTEQSCIDFIAQLRWNGKPECPHCGHNKSYKFKNGKLFKCAICRKQFTVKVGTIFEDSALPLQKWFMAMYLFTAHKKGISSLQLSRDIGITQKSAWFMLHRIRYAMSTKSFNAPLGNMVEADETYVGGIRKGGRGRTTAQKTPVLGLVERKGKVFSTPITSPSRKIIGTFVNLNVSQDATLITDEWHAYKGLRKKHLVIKHSSGQHVKGNIHTNTVEGFWSLLKRGIIGIYHQVSPKHLHRYCSEFNYRYNTKEFADNVRFAQTFTKINGRLMYQTLVND